MAQISVGRPMPLTCTLLQLPSLQLHVASLTCRHGQSYLEYIELKKFQAARDVLNQIIDMRISVRLVSVRYSCSGDPP